MNDATTVADLRALVEAFVAERGWRKFHSPKNLAMALSVEAAELAELFIWTSERESARATHASGRRHASEELADIIIFALAFANRTGIDVADAVRQKLKKNRRKYPAAAFRGRV